jgi:hypothetical protein
MSFEVLPALLGKPAHPGCMRHADTPKGQCGKDVAWHVIWTPDGRNGLLCGEHYHEARRLWVYYEMHPVRVACTIAGASYDLDAHGCFIDESPS